MLPISHRRLRHQRTQTGIVRRLLQMEELFVRDAEVVDDLGSPTPDLAETTFDLAPRHGGDSTLATRFRCLPWISTGGPCIPVAFGSGAN